MAYLWGIDLGGTKIEGVVLDDHHDNRVIRRLRLPTEQESGYHHIIGQVKRLVDQLVADTGLVPHRIGIGTPGTIDPPTQLLKNSNTLCLNARPLHDDLARALGVPVVLANDANCFAVAETLLGAVSQARPDARVVFGIIMGTGVGGGLVIDGQIWGGTQGIGGEWGHSFLDESGGKCYCGNTGCVEMVLAGPALEKYYFQRSGQRRRMQEIVQLHLEQTDPEATATVERMLHFFGKAVANLINIIDPDAIVLGGGLANIDMLYQQGVERIADFVFNVRLDTPIIRPRLGDSAGVFGAAMLVSEQRAGNRQ